MGLMGYSRGLRSAVKLLLAFYPQSTAMVAVGGGSGGFCGEIGRQQRFLWATWGVHF